MTIIRKSFCALLLLSCAATAALALDLAIPLERGRYDTRILTDQDPVLAEIFSMANDVGFRVGTWGGASRDFLLGRGTPPEFSDVDMVYDSRDLWQALKSEGPVGFVKKTARMAKGFWRIARVGGLKALKRYTYLDAKEGGRTLTTGVVPMINSGAGTINQIGLMSDGTVFDPTSGLEDLSAGQLRYRTPKPISTMVSELNDIHNPSPYDVLRMVRFKVQYPELEWAPGTFERLQEIMDQYAPGSEFTNEVAAYHTGVGGAVRKLIPKALRHPISALRSNLGSPDRKDLWPFVEKGLKKVLASTPDPVESLRLYKELGMDVFAREIGLGHYVDELEAKASGAPPPVSRPVLEQSAPSVTAVSALEELKRQAYSNYMEAQENGDMDALKRHYELYLTARQRLDEQASR